SENVIQPQMSIPGGKRAALILRMKKPVDVQIIGVEHNLYGFSLNFAPADPDQSANPGRHALNVQQFAGRKRIEIASQNVKSFLMPFDAFEQSSNLSCPPPLAPFRENGAQVKPEDAQFASLRNDLQEGMFRARRMMPLVMGNLDSADIAD